MIRFKHRGSFANTERFFRKSLDSSPIAILNYYGQLGVRMLASATPVDTGLTSLSWGYEITQNPNGYSIVWTNDNVNDGVNIAVILQYGHGTGTGGYVRGIDYINPAIRPIFENLANDAWKEVTSK